MLSGVNNPLDTIPEFLQQVMLVYPTNHFVTFSQSVVFRGAGLDIVWRQLLATVGIGGLAFMVALVRLKGIDS